MKRNKSKGITLIALIITIIIMLILVAVIISTSIKSELISKAQTAKKDYLEKEKEEENFDKTIKIGNETLEEFLAEIDNDEPTLNEYGFYYNKSYKIDKDWWADGEHGEDDNAIIKVLENGNMYVKSYEKELYKYVIDAGHWNSGPGDFFGKSIRQSAEGDYAFDNVKPNVTYNAKASLNSDFNFVINENGDLITTYIISKENIKLSEKQIILGDEANEHFTFEVLADGNKLLIKEINKVFTIVD